MNLINKKAVFCQICGKCLGEYRENYAVDHSHRHPSHNDFLVIIIKDPLLIDEPDQWFKSQKITPDYIDPTIFDRLTNPTRTRQNLQTTPL